jgi:phytoene synthase
MHLAGFFIPRQKRDALAAVTGFARQIRLTLAGGGCGCGGGAGIALLNDLYATHLASFDVPRQYLTDLLGALTTDANTTRYATWTALERHCAGTGGNVARIAASVLGVTHTDACLFAETIGIATRLTEILCDLRVDLRHNRVYLPLEDLIRFRYTERELLAREANTSFRKLIRFQVERARQLFRGGSAGLCWLATESSRLAAAGFVASQLATLDAIERAGFDLLNGDLRLSRARKLRQIPVAWRLARRLSDEPMPKVC